MKLIRFVLFCLLVFTQNIEIKAQKRHSLLLENSSRMSSHNKNGITHFITKTPWRVTLGWNIIDDDGKPFKDVFDFQKSWNFAAYPVKLAIEKECLYNINVELALAYNNYKSGKIVNGDVIASNKSLFSVDLNAKYIVTKLFKIEPYVLVGLGYTHRSTTKYQSTETLNGGVGFTGWIIDNELGIVFQGTGKFGLVNPLFKSGANYLQHTIGVVYKFSGNRKQLKAAQHHLNKYL